jgi:hypothetical protein
MQQGGGNSLLHPATNPAGTRMSEKTHTVNESADKIRLKAEVKRGSGTRDQDKVNLTIKGSDPEETANRLKATLDALEANGVSQQLRDTQPENEE